jgi:hypothetical protein
VSAWAEQDEAVDASWLAPGVTYVDDQIRIAYKQANASAARATFRRSRRSVARRVGR